MILNILRKIQTEIVYANLYLFNLVLPALVMTIKEQSMEINNVNVLMDIPTKIMTVYATPH